MRSDRHWYPGLSGHNGRFGLPAVTIGPARQNLSMLTSERSTRLSLAQALLDKRVVAGLAATNPALALALQTMRLRVLLRQHIAVAYARHAATAARRSAEDAAFYRTSGWEAAVHAASQPPQPNLARPQDALMQRLGMLELLLQHSAMAARAAAAHAPAVHPAACHLADDASSQCCGDSAPRGAKRAAGGTAGDAGRAGSKRARNIAYIEIRVSTPAGSRKPGGMPQAGAPAYTPEASGTECSARTCGQPIQELARLAQRHSSPSVDAPSSSDDSDSELEDDASTISLVRKRLSAAQP
ncbi:hypothetical protein CVIRNUC_003986 [Coccomyxa viridis]|uniref:Uncharacterized protein n=1 Tax=Coccomyxa viridis TaxID=1274662 RepID=A0AAV1I084_9CHLO|nr:hypothetical protein CVIRNUC_003986 [Coccomyxa viridis]